MNILTVEQKQLNLNLIDDVIPITQFAVVDLGSDLNHYNEIDIIFPKLIYIAEQTGAAVLCDIGGYEVFLPLSWNIFVGDEDSAEVEVLPICELNARQFQAIVTNPISGFRHHFAAGYYNSLCVRLTIEQCSSTLPASIVSLISLRQPLYRSNIDTTNNQLS